MDNKDYLIFVFIFLALIVIGVSSRLFPETAGDETSGIVYEETQKVKAPAKKTLVKTVTPQKQLTQEEINKKLSLINEKVQEIKGKLEESPYKGKVYISRLSIDRTEDPEKEYLTLTSNSKENINITGWKVENANTGANYIIGKGAETYYTGASSYNDPIILKRGEKAVIKTGYAPFGPSFKINKCSGYLTQFATFTPQLALQCPAIKNMNIPVPFTPENYNCYDYIKNAPICRTVTADKKTLKKKGLTDACIDFFQNGFNYNYCVRDHKNDSDFYKGEWRVFARSGAPLWRKIVTWKTTYQTIRLLDLNGKVVSTYNITNSTF